MSDLMKKRKMLNWAFDSALERGDLTRAGKYLAQLDRVDNLLGLMIECAA